MGVNALFFRKELAEIVHATLMVLQDIEYVMRHLSGARPWLPAARLRVRVRETAHVRHVRAWPAASPASSGGTV